MDSDPLCQLKEECHGHLSHRSSAVGGNVRDRNGSSLGCFDIDDIVTRSQDTDVFQTWAVYHGLDADGRLVGQDHLRIVRPVDNVLQGGAFVNRTGIDHGD